MQYISITTLSRSSASLAVTEARAKAEAARTKAAYAKRQIDIEVEKARIEVERVRIDATLNALKEEGEAEAALAAANVLEAAVDLDVKERIRKSSDFSSAQQSLQRTSEYVNAHFNSQQKYKLEQTENEEPQAAHASQPICSQHTEARNTSQSPPQSAPRNLCWRKPEITSPSPRVGSPSHVPTPRPSDISDLAAYLACRDLILSGLKMFDNRRENYLSWKACPDLSYRGLELET